MTLPNLLDHPPVQRVLSDPATRYWLRDLLILAADREPVDTIADFDEARTLVASYLRTLIGPDAVSLAQETPEGR